MGHHVAHSLLLAMFVTLVLCTSWNLVGSQISVQSPYSCPATCDSDFHVCSPRLNKTMCPEGSIFDPTAGPCGCCGACVRYLGEMELCAQLDSAPRTMLEDGTIQIGACDPGQAVCAKNNTEYPSFICKPIDWSDRQCFKRTVLMQKEYDKLVDGGYNVDYYIFPDCDPDGTFSAVQRRVNKNLDFSRLFCADRDGRRLFGDVFYDMEGSDKINCACSRTISDMLLADPSQHVTLTCDTMGNFRDLQCQDDLCFCVNSTTGSVTGPFVPQASMFQLPCYESSAFPNGNYFKDKTCGSYKDRLARIRRLYASHGTSVTGLTSPNCGFDHNYAPVYDDTSGSTRRCVHPDGSYTVFQADSSTDTSKMDCNCARDTKLMEEAGMGASLLRCEGYGDYKPLQDPSSVSCVNADGMRCSSRYQDPNNRCCLPCFSTTCPANPDCTDSITELGYCGNSQLTP